MRGSDGGRPGSDTTVPVAALLLRRVGEAAGLARRLSPRLSQWDAIISSSPVALFQGPSEDRERRQILLSAKLLLQPDDRRQIQDPDDEAGFYLHIDRVPDEILISAPTSDSPK